MNTVRPVELQEHLLIVEITVIAEIAIDLQTSQTPEDEFRLQKRQICGVTGFMAGRSEWKLRVIVPRADLPSLGKLKVRRGISAVRALLPAAQIGLRRQQLRLQKQTFVE